MKTNKIFVGLVMSCIILLSFGQNCCIQNSIKVQGLGEYKIQAEIAVLYSSISADGATANEALGKIDLQLDQVYSALQLAGVAQNDIQTSSIGAYPRYNYVDGTSVVIGYSVYLSLTVNVANIHLNNQKIAKVIDALATAGVTYISGIGYDTFNPNAGKSTARVYAWNEAVLRAKQYAKLAVRTLGKVLIIEEVSTNYYPYYYGAASSL